MAKDATQNLAASDRHAELKDLAFSIFANEVRGKRNGFSGTKVAAEAFRLAREFLDHSDNVELEPELALRPAEEKAVFVDVQLWEQVGEKWKPTVDQFGKRVVEKQLMDPDSFAPNLPVDHPINQRSGPRARAALMEAIALREKQETEGLRVS